MALAQGRFSRDQRIRKRSEFRCIMNGGVRVLTPHCIFVVASRQSSCSSHLGPRLGLVVSRKVGPAVLRNRFKRLAREVFRKTQSQLPSDAEIVVIARNWTRTLRETNLAEEWASVHARIETALGRHRNKYQRMSPTAPEGATC